MGGGRRNAQPQLLRPFKPNRAVGGSENEAALCQVARHQAGKRGLGGGVKGGGRLVQQPQRPPHRDQARDREPAPLPGGQVGSRQVGEGAQADRRQRRLGFRRAAAKETGPEIEVFSHRQGRFQRIEMPEVMGLLAHRELRIAPLQREPPPADMHQPRDQPQQRGFPRPVGPDNYQRLPGSHGKSYAGKDLPAAPVAGQIGA